MKYFIASFLFIVVVSVFSNNTFATEIKTDEEVGLEAIILDYCEEFGYDRKELVVSVDWDTNKSEDSIQILSTATITRKGSKSGLVVHGFLDRGSKDSVSNFAYAVKKRLEQHGISKMFRVYTYSFSVIDLT